MLFFKNLKGASVNDVYQAIYWLPTYFYNKRVND